MTEANRTEDLEAEIDFLAGEAERMSKRWCRDASLFLERGQPGAAVMLASLIQLTRGVLEHLPPESREHCVRAIATPGIAVGPACQRVTS